MGAISDFLSTLGQNALGDVGNIVKGMGALPDQINKAVQSPKNAVKFASDIGGGIANEANQFLGDPLHNQQLIGVQSPTSVAKTTISQAQHAYQHPVNTVLDLGSAIGLGNIGSKEPNLVQKTGENLKNGSIQVQPSAEINGAERQAATQNVINNIPGKSASEKFANLPKSMSDLSDEINSKLNSNPKDIPVNQIQSTLMKKIQPLVLQGTISEPDAIAEVESYVSRMYNAAVGKNDMPAVENTPEAAAAGQSSVPYVKFPDTISSPDVFQMKTLANKATQGLWNKPMLTNSQEVTMALRNGMDDIISQFHPDIKDMTLKQSALYDAPQALVDAMKNNKGLKLGPMPLPIPSGVVDAGRNVAGDALGKVGSLPALGGLAPAIGNDGEQPMNNMPKDINNNNQIDSANQEVPHNSGISPTPGNVNSGVTSKPGRYSLTTPQTEGFMTTNDYTNQVNSIQSRLPQEKLNDPQKATQDQAMLDQLNTSYNNQKPIRDEFTKTNTVMGLGNAAFNLINSAPVGLLNLNGSFDKLLNSTDPKYAALGKALQGIQNTTGINLSSAKTKEALVASLDYAISYQQNSFNAQQQEYFGGNTLNAGSSPSNNLPPVQNSQPVMQFPKQTDASAIIQAPPPVMQFPSQ